MTASFRVGSDVYSIATPASITNATGHAAGDIIVIVASYYDNPASTITIPGFTSIIKELWTGAGTTLQEWFYKTDNGAEPSTYSYNYTLPVYVDFVCFAVTGCDPTNPIEVVSGISANAGITDSIVIPTMTLGLANSALMAVANTRNAATTTPYPITKISNRGADDTFVLMGDPVGVGSTGTKTVPVVPGTADNPSCAVMVAFSPVIGPLVISQPTPATVVVGETASFAVVAVASSGSVTYQWNLNGASIPGATSATYTTPVLRIGNSGTLYNCILTDSNGSVYSSYAQLTVLSAFSLFVDRAGATRFDFKVGPAPDPSLFDLYADRGGATVVDLIVPAVAATVVTGENLFFGSGSTQ